MTSTTDGMGRVAFVCDACARNRRGLCRDCPSALGYHNRMRCPACAATRSRTADRKRDQERYPVRRSRVLEHHRRRNEIPEIRERHRQYMHAYRQAHPRDAWDRAYMRAYMASRRADPTYRARENARKRAWRAKERAA